MASLEILLKIRRAFIIKDNDVLEELLQNHEKISFLPESEELENMRKFLENLKDTKGIVQKMQSAIKEKSKDKIMNLLAEGKILKIQWNPDLFKQAMETLKKQSEVNYYKDKAKQTKSIGIIQVAIQKAEQNDPKDPDIEELKELKNAVKDLIEECIVALNVVEKSQMELVLSKARSMEISNDLTETLRLLLEEMDNDNFSELQFKVALKLNDQKLLIKRMIAKKNREIMNIPNADKIWMIEKCPLLQDPLSWAKKSFFGDILGLEERQNKFLKWMKNPIHKPLTKVLDKKLISEGIENFKNIQYFMGDKEHKSPSSCAQAIIHLGAHNELLRDEIYLQIMKQLIENPNPSSVEKGWQLMAYCLRCFSPIVTQNYLDYFIRKNSNVAEQLLIIMYTKLLFGMNSQMQVNEIRTMTLYILVLFYMY